MKRKHKLSKILGILAASIVGFCILCHGALMTWTNVAVNNNLPSFIHNSFKSLFFIDKKINQEVEDFKTKTNGVMRGICHPYYEQTTLQKVEEANINWVRLDIPAWYPLMIDEDFNPIIVDEEYVASSDLNAFINNVQFYQQFNQKVMLITPGLEDMLNFVGEREIFVNGGEFTEKFINFSKACAQIYAKTLAPYVDAFQICNETDIPQWKGALTTEQMVYFIGDVMMKEMHQICFENNCVIGFNQTMLGQYKLANDLTKNYGEYFDYVSVDLYAGCFEPYTKFMSINEFYVKYLYYITRKPIVITEFGYIGHGESMTSKEKKQYLRETYGEKFDNEKKIIENFVEFIDIFNEKGRTEFAIFEIAEIEYDVETLCKTDEEKQKYLNSFSPYDSIEKMNADKLGFLAHYEKIKFLDKTSSLVKEAKRIMNADNFSEKSIKEAANYFFTYGREHLYKTCNSKIGVIGYKHTEEGQAKYLTDFVRRLAKKNYVCEFFLYELLESNHCYFCNQFDCPIETGWGLIRINKGDSLNYSFENAYIKPSYYAIQKVYGELKNAQ